MPLTGPGGGGDVDLIDEIIITSPNSDQSYDFLGLDISQDRAYKIEFEFHILWTQPPGGITKRITQRTNQTNIQGSLATFCTEGCLTRDALNIDAVAQNATHIIGNYTWRKMNTSDFVVMFGEQALFSGGALATFVVTNQESFVSQGIVSNINPQANVTSVGLRRRDDANWQVTDTSVIRLYKGIG